jgi:tetratricopeptide (TPR) repeat protein
MSMIGALFHNSQGRKYHHEGLIEKALAAYDKAIAANPSWKSPWYNKGLIFKYQKEWRKSFDCNLRATELSRKDQAAWWNLGIAATALRNWRVARSAWNACGMEFGDSDEECRTSFGMGPVRVNPDSEGEVLWGERVDPARFILDSIPFPKSGFKYGDIVLNDGAPVGSREVDGREYPVFTVLDLFESSKFRTYVWRTKDWVIIEKVDAFLTENGGRLENWSKTVRNLCRQCSEGVVHDVHEAASGSEPEIQNIGIAVESDKSIEEINRRFELKNDEMIRQAPGTRPANRVWRPDWPDGNGIFPSIGA